MHLFEYLLDVEEDLDLLDLTAAVNKVYGMDAAVCCGAGAAEGAHRRTNCYSETRNCYTD